MKLALVQAPVWWTVDPPLGLAQIAGCAKAAGHEVEIFDLNILLWKRRTARYENLWLWEQFHFWNQPEIVAQFFDENQAVIETEMLRILRSDAKVIGFSVCLGSQWASLELSRRIKKEDPSRVIVWGGQFFFKGQAAKEWIRHPEIDAIVQGPGDEVFPALLKRVESSGTVLPAAGIACRVDGRAIDGGMAPAIRDLDGVPFADLSGFPMEYYSDPIRIPFAASRGCVWKCHFCSTTQFWSGYSYMSGERMFAEVMHQRKVLPGHNHVEFYDITANGDVRALRCFSEKVAEVIGDPDKYIGWKINAIIRPEMSSELLKTMRRANGHSIIYGIESGSPKVLESMNKPFRLEVADRVLRDTHEAGITVTGNFMFGYPGETEEDFQQTLDFIRRNAAWLDRAYASATFTSLEEHSYLTDHSAEMGIAPMPAGRFHNLYWKSADGKNDYEVRLDRYRRFREAAIALGIDAYKGVNGNLDQDQWANLAQFKQFQCDHVAAIENFLKYLEGDLYHQPMRAQLSSYRPLLEALCLAQRAVEKANRLLVEDPGVAAELIPWAVPHLNNGGLPEAPERTERWRLICGCLSRARAFLQRMPEERRAGLHARDSEFKLVWIEKELPPRERMEALRDRVALILDLAEAEIARGEHRKEAPQCRR